MCGRFVMVSYDEVRGIVSRIEQRQALVALPDWPLIAGSVDGSRAQRLLARSNAYPKSQVYVFGDAGLLSCAPAFAGNSDNLGIALLTWGYSVEWKRDPLFNTRIESALSGRGMWRESLESRRCVIPTAGFFEPHAQEKVTSRRTGRPVKRPYLFGAADGTPTLLAGVFENGRCSVITTQPNAQVEPIHNRMPLVLEPCEALTWLKGPLDEIAALADRSGEHLCVAPEDELAASFSDNASDIQPSLF